MSAAVPEFVASMCRGWHRQPESLALGSTRTGVSAALWKHDGDDLQELDNGGGTLDQHVISIQNSSYHAEAFKDGRHLFSKVVRPGGVSWMEVGVKPRAVHRGRWSVLQLYVPNRLFMDLAFDCGSTSFEAIDPECRIDTTVERIGREVLTEMRENLQLSRLRIEVLGQDIAIHLLRFWSNLAGTSRVERALPKGGLAPWQVKRVSEFMEDRLADDVSLEDLARLLDLSSFHLCRAFKQSTGLPPHRWRMQRRIEHAREMLESTELAVTEIAARVGFDSSGFAAAFRKATGVSPSQYRRARRS